MTEKIDPRELIARYSLAEHASFADAYFAGRETHAYLYQKPFYHPQACAPLVENLGALLNGLALNEGDRVLDFAAGSCWLSRILVQLGCQVTSCDASAQALAIGKSLFERFPPIMASGMPAFLHFNGTDILLPDSSVDRVVVNDAFHHIPNPERVLQEFYRVLDNGGLVGMSEPGRFHAQTEASQFEMRTYNVIENDFVVEEIWEMARAIGFTDIRILPVLRNHALNLTQYLDCIGKGTFSNQTLQHLVQGTLNHSILFLYKSASPDDGNSPIDREDEFDAEFYLAQHPDVARAVAQGALASAWLHYCRHGRDEGRAARKKR